jgi:hypothetical protein
MEGPVAEAGRYSVLAIGPSMTFEGQEVAPTHTVKFH